MKIRKFFENKQNEVEIEFKKALNSGSSSPNLYYLNKDWDEYSKDYHLYDHFYLYKNCIFSLNRTSDYSWTLEKLKDYPHVFQQKIFDQIQQLEKAFNMLD